MCMCACGLQSGYLAAPVAVAAPSASACKTRCWQALWDFNTWIRAYEQVQRPSWNITSLDLTNAAWRIQCNKKKRGAVTAADTPPTTPLDAPRAIRHTRPGSVCHASIRSPQHHAQVAHTSWSPHPFRPHPHDDCTPRSQPSAPPVTPKQIALSHLTTKALRPGMCEAPTTQAPLPPPRPRAHRRPRRPRDADTGTAPATVRRRLLSTLCKEIVTAARIVCRRSALLGARMRDPQHTSCHRPQVLPTRSRGRLNAPPRSRCSCPQESTAPHGVAPPATPRRGRGHRGASWCASAHERRPPASPTRTSRAGKQVVGAAARTRRPRAGALHLRLQDCAHLQRVREERITGHARLRELQPAEHLHARIAVTIAELARARRTTRKLRAPSGSRVGQGRRKWEGRGGALCQGRRWRIQSAPDAPGAASPAG